MRAGTFTAAPPAPSMTSASLRDVAYAAALPFGKAANAARRTPHGRGSGSERTVTTTAAARGAGRASAPTPVVLRAGRTPGTP